MPNVQEEGEDFEVHWTSLEMAAAKMTYEEDQEVVSIALTAVAQWTTFSNTSYHDRLIWGAVSESSHQLVYHGLLCVCLEGQCGCWSIEPFASSVY